MPEHSNDPTNEAFGRVERFRVDGLDSDQASFLAALTAALQGKMPRALVDESGRVTGAVNFLLLDPLVGEAFTNLGNAITRELPPRLREITILEASRSIGSTYEWVVHEKLGRDVGLTDDEISAIRHGTESPSMTESECLARRIVAGVLIERAVDDELYESALHAFGPRTLYDIVVHAGYYALMETTIIAFQAPVPGGVEPLALSKPEAGV
jgi:alkylhydroperoxidase family enzyme